MLSHSFTVYVAAVLISFIAALLLGRRLVLTIGILASTLLYLGALNVMNAEQFIAESNFNHYTLYGKQFDRRNFQQLGDDAVPTMVRRLPELEPLDQQALLQLLSLQLERDEAFHAINDWRGANLARNAALDLLRSRRDTLRQACLPAADFSERDRAAKLRQAREQAMAGAVPTFCFR